MARTNNQSTRSSREELQRCGALPIMQISMGKRDHDHESTAGSPTAYGRDGPTAKARKISRACDFCKVRKSKCSGDQPCSKCVARSRTCTYNTQYTRGRAFTPPPSAAASSSTGFQAGLDQTPDPLDEPDMGSRLFEQQQQPARCDSVPHRQSVPGTSRASPELGELDMAEIQGQVFDPTSGLTFLHRAWKRLAAHGAHTTSESVRASADDQHITMAGDRALLSPDEVGPIYLPDSEETAALLDLYFDVCIATYRILHRPTVKLWLRSMETSLQQGNPIWHKVGPAKAAIVLVALAIAKIHQEKSKGFFHTDDESRAQSESDRLFGISVKLTDQETGYPKLESAQARIVQTLYLLTTSRFNRGWYVFGDALRIISAIGLHRRENPKDRSRRGAPRVSEDYILAQCRLRTFWTAYVLDNYLGVVFGRPRFFHDEDIDQAFPDRINDEDMTTSGLIQDHENAHDFDIDALIFHAKIGQIIGSITREIYTIKSSVSESDRATAASRLIQKVHDWRASLPVHLGLVRPSMLAPAYRRQATVLRLAYSHAIMHASRLFILSNKHSHPPNDSKSPDDNECISAARAVLETVDHLAREGPLFHAFWWTHYVTFCALVVTYVWEIQQRRLHGPMPGNTSQRVTLLELAKECHMHLARATATNSPSRRYAVILEEFRAAATGQTQPASSNEPTMGHLLPQQQQDQQQSSNKLQPEHSTEEIRQDPDLEQQQQQQSFILDPHLLDAWQTTDWLDLDSSAFWSFVDVEESMTWPGIG